MTGSSIHPRNFCRAKSGPRAACCWWATQGTLYSPNDYGAQHVLLPRDKFKTFKPPEPTLPRTHGVGNEDARHLQEWAAACRGGEPGMSNFNYASRLTETMLLGNLRSAPADGSSGTPRIRR